MRTEIYVCVFVEKWIGCNPHQRPGAQTSTSRWTLIENVIWKIVFYLHCKNHMGEIWIRAFNDDKFIKKNVFPNWGLRLFDISLQSEAVSGGSSTRSGTFLHERRKKNTKLSGFYQQHKMWKWQLLRCLEDKTVFSPYILWALYRAHVGKREVSEEEVHHGTKPQKMPLKYREAENWYKTFSCSCRMEVKQDDSNFWCSPEESLKWQ